MKLKQKEVKYSMNKAGIASALSIAALVATSFGSAAFASSGISISGNGFGSDNSVNVRNTSNTNLTQTNTSDVSVRSTVNQSTGNNSASFNTGGGSDITTGDATSHTMVNVGGGYNQASLGCLCNTNGGSSVNINGNGALSRNFVTLNGGNTFSATQRNNSNVMVDTYTTQRTGYNNASFNTGWGTNRIRTGNANTSLDVTTEGGINLLTP